MTVTGARPTLAEIRGRTTEFQKKLLQQIWEYFRNQGDWPRLRSLYGDHNSKKKVREALMALGGSIGREENGTGRWTIYRLTLLGTMLTADGPRFEMLFRKLLQYERDLSRTQSEKEQSTAEEIKTALGLDDEQTALLGRLVWLAHMGGSRNDKDGTWTLSAMDEASDFPSGDLVTETDEWLCRIYVPDAPVFHDQQDQYIPPSMLSGNETPDAASQMVEPKPLAAFAHPPEIGPSLEKLRVKYPDASKLGFLIMRFSNGKPFEQIVKAIKDTAKKHGLEIIRADDVQFHADLLGHIRTLLHGCSFGIAVYERIEKDEPNANVGLEVGYLMAMNKPVLLLKDKTLPVLHSDLAGRLYTPFDPHDPESSIPDKLTKWLTDNGIIV